MKLFRFSERVAALLTRPCPRSLGILVFTVSMLLSILLNLAFLKTDQHRTTECFDGQNYFIPMARSLWKQGIPLNVRGDFCTHQGPGYPLVLAPVLALGDALSATPVQVAQTLNIVFAGIAAIGVLQLAKRMMTWPFAVVAALMFSVYPPFVWLTRNAYNEPLFSALLLWGLLSVLSGFEDRKPTSFFWGMALLGMATLTRAVGLLIPVVIFFAFVVGNFHNYRFWRDWFIGLLIYVMVMAPWIFAASRHAGHLVIATTSFAGSHIDGLTSIKSNPLALQAVSYFQSHTHDISGIKSFHLQALPYQLSSYMNLTMQKLFDSWTATEAGSGRTTLLIMNAPLLVLMVIAIWYLLICTKQVRRTEIMLLLMLCYFWGMNVMVWSTMRYMVPISFVPILLIARSLEVWWRQSWQHLPDEAG